MPWHHFVGRRPVEAIALYIVGLPGDQRSQQGREVDWVHLSVRRHHRGQVRAEQERLPTPGRNRSTDTLVGFVLDELDGPEESARCLARGVDARVIYYDDVVHEARNALKRPPNQLCFVVRRHHDGDSSPREHLSSLDSNGCQACSEWLSLRDSPVKHLQSTQVRRTPLRVQEVLFASKPVAPPWNDSSKNLVRDIAGHLQRHSPVLMGRSGQANPIARGRVEPVYGAASGGGFAPSARANAGVLRHLLMGRSTDLWHFFFAPNPNSSAAGRLATAIRRVPSVHTVCSLPAEGVSTRKLLFADVTVALSRAAYERFRQDGVSESALHLIPPSVPPLAEPTSLERAALRKKHRLPDALPIWIYPGDLEFGGGAEIALQGFAAWNRSDAVLLMACRRKTPQADEALSRLREQARRWGIEAQVHWLGETRHIHELLGLSDFVVMVNRTAYAKMDYPLVALEAMCLARPVLVGKETPSAELAEDGGAVAVETNGEALAEAIESLSADQASYSEVGQTARALATSKFSPQEVAAAYELLYEEIHG